MRHSRAPTSERGWLSIGVIWGLALLGIITAFIAQRSVESVTAASALIEGARAYDRALKEGAAHLGDLILTPHQTITTLSGQSRAGRTELTVSLDLVASTRPLFDFGAALRDAPPCKSLTPADPTRTPHGDLLTPTSVRAHTTCTAPAPLVSTTYGARANFSIESPVRLAAADALPPAPLLVSPGFIDLAGPLELATDGVVLAGGDIFVQALVNTAGRPLSAALISTTGRIVVREVRGSVALRLLAHRGFSAPSDARATELAPLPPIIPHILLRLVRGRRD